MLDTQQPRLILASASPRRRELLEQIGLSFTVDVADIDETARPEEPAVEFVQRMAMEKAVAIGQIRQQQDCVILAADTVVSIDQNILGKPQHETEALAMYQQLSGRTHEVFSAICVLRDRQQWTALQRSEVSFCKMSEEVARRYWATAEGRDKAGGYAIQGLAAQFVTHLSGSYSGVMGLPLFETAKLLNLAGITVLSTNHE